MNDTAKNIGIDQTEIVYALICFITGLIALFPTLGLLYYDINISDRYRTLVNEIYVLVLSYMITFILFMNTFVILRTLYGPLPVFMCHLFCLAILGFLVPFCMALNETVLTKYLYCCIFKSTGGLDDKLYSRFFAILNPFLAFYMASFLHYGHMGPDGPFIYCSGCDSNIYMQPKLYKSRIPFPIYTVWLTLAFHMVVQYKLRQTKHYLETQSQETAVSHREAILSTWLNIALLTIVGVLGCFSLIGMDNNARNDIMPLTRPMLNIVMCGLPAYSYTKHSNIRKFVIGCIRKKLFRNRT